MTAWLENWAWQRWEKGSTIRSTPMPVPEVSSSAATADLRRPFVVRGLLNGTAVLADGTAWLRASPVGAVEVPYYTDASNGALWPDAVATIAEVVDAIEAGGPQKLGTELVFRRHPELLETLGLTAPLAQLFGQAPFAQWRVGTLLTVPIFLGTGATDGTTRVRTDLHSEPIGSATLQLAGRKRWTLVPADQSYRLRPSLSADGRAFFATRRAHGANGVAAIAAAGCAHYEVEQRPGDVLWVPTWTWHRVDYVPNVTAFSVSLFHVRPQQLATYQPLFTAAVIPALLKEFVGWNTQ